MVHNIRNDIRTCLHEMVLQEPSIDIYLSNFFVTSILHGLHRRGRAVVRLHNHESVFMYEALLAEPSRIGKLKVLPDVWLTRVAERRIFRLLDPSDTILTCTDSDRMAIEGLHMPKARVDVLPLCAPNTAATRVNSVTNQHGHTAIFTGTLDSGFNLEAAEWLVQKCGRRSGKECMVQG